MDYQKFLTQTIDEGIEAAKADYAFEWEKARLEGSIKGFEACREKPPDELRRLLFEARKQTRDAREKVHKKEISEDEFWGIRCYEAEIEWVCNVVSAALINIGAPPIDSLLPTARGVEKAAAIAGVADSKEQKK